MMQQKVSENHEMELSEKCRIALEKAFGIEIPVPKSMVKKDSKQKS